ncbi:hypothetical protein BDY17DRAFT_147290 [Neohortaea acidophila]|uniref:F-box domain-containing protein n=1 Tax=Neohortaea acidophila TaxID=245834 RepID=A0A6A6PU42_9PEZI|nr:uncharacterized protein BDY17DRAFT_147290 [Neohortaea acidophila]KAF2483425.1 hypothetical protein BDY17DRAFT_147290 [Neohortaea acidophila]
MARKKAIQENPQTDSALFIPPLELRTNIYQQLFRMSTLDQPLNLIKVPKEQARKKRPTVLSVLLTCRRIHREVETIFFAINHFAFEMSDVASSLSSWSPSSLRLPTPRLESIRTLTLSSVRQQRATWFVRHRLQQMPQLNVLTFDVQQCDFRHMAATQMIQEYRQLEGVPGYTKETLAQLGGMDMIRYGGWLDAGGIKVGVWCEEFIGKEYVAILKGKPRVRPPESRSGTDERPRVVVFCRRT